ncbi:MAG: hypothetical protein JWP79_1149 [Polaromonas sp.]|nr:hypothetical protein [Polaromonas sp.]
MLQLDLNGCNIHQSGLRCWINNDVKIALLCIESMKNGTKHPRIASPMSRHHATNGDTV